MICVIIESILTNTESFDATPANSTIKNYICQSFIFSYLWSLGSNLIDSSQNKFEDLVFNQFKEKSEVAISPGMKLFDMYLNTKNKTFESWESIVPNFIYNANVAYFELLVPTVESVRYTYIMQKLVQMNQPVMLTGLTGKHQLYLSM